MDTPVQVVNNINRFKACATNVGMPQVFEYLLEGKSQWNACLQHISNDPEYTAADEELFEKLEMNVDSIQDYLQDFNNSPFLAITTASKKGAEGLYH